MKKQETCIHVKKDNKPAYDILLRHDFSELPQALEALDVRDHKIAIITDSHVAPIYADDAVKVLAPVCKEAAVYVIPAGEAHKNLSEIQKIYHFLIEHHFDRRDFLLALGGGVVGDMTGFAAATYLRGIRFIQVPTTLLSQVDSSIGGKTGVDFDQYKNMVGAFHQPSLVYMNMSTLRTLPEEQFSSGMGEILKHGLIREASYYEWVIEHMEEINERNEDILLQMVYGSCQIKRAVVEKDPTEQGERALLNFGHTLGHAIEKLKDFQLMHGHCVALGTVAAAYISWKRGNLTDGEFFEIRDMNVGFDLPITFDGISSEDILAATRLDKKMTAGHIKFVLLNGIGKAYTDMTVTDQEMLDALRSMNADELEDSSLGYE